jgi:hypothetical protein
MAEYFFSPVKLLPARAYGITRLAFSSQQLIDAPVFKCDVNCSDYPEDRSVLSGFH